MFAAEVPLSGDRRNAAPQRPLDEDAFAAEMRGPFSRTIRRRSLSEGGSRFRRLLRRVSSPMLLAGGARLTRAPISPRVISRRVPLASSSRPDGRRGRLGRRAVRLSGSRPPGELDYEGVDEAPARDGFLRLRPWHAVAAIALIAVGGLAWGFAKRSGVIGSREIATIAAPDGPAKVPPAANAVADASVDKPDAAVLDRHENAPVKHVVSHQEQAVEPKVEPRAVYNGADQATRTAPLRRRRIRTKEIKTVSVRPDGSIISNAVVPPAVAKAAGAGSRRRRQTLVDDAAERREADGHAACGKDDQAQTGAKGRRR